MKSVLISIQPKWCELIANGSKTVEVRKTKPKLETPFKVYIYCTKSRKPYESFAVSGKPYECGGKVIGEFVCDDVTKIINCGSHFIAEDRSYCELNTIAKCSRLDFIDMKKYLGNKNCYAWHISDLVIYDKPRELVEFYRECERPECEDCPHLCVENTPMYYEVWCPYDEKIPITRPPQSWCYVESGSDNNDR